MDRLEWVLRLNEQLLWDMPEYRALAAQVPSSAEGQRRLLRSLMNLRPPMPVGEKFLRLQDRLLSDEREEKGVVEVMALPVTAAYAKISLWQGDITRLRAEAIVNAANSALLGCFYPCHGCIDNAIHSAAGIQLRQECARLMEKQGQEEKTGRAKITDGYNLPAKYVLHTVGPIVDGSVTEKDRRELASCYRSCLELAAERELKSVAFCCISTGEFHFPNREAAEIAVETVKIFLERESSIQRVVFNVFKNQDRDIYRELLGPDREAPGGP